MSVYKIFPSKDATIYSGLPTINTGRDEILEISSINSSNAIGVTEGYDDIRRTLIQFDDSDLSTLSEFNDKPFKTYLRLFLADAANLSQNYTIECYPIYQDWVMGTGKFPDSPNPKNGASWYTAGAYKQGPAWNSSSADQSYLYTTGGGTWNAMYSASQTFNYIASKDLKLDVTDIVTEWFSGSIPNHGFLLKLTGSIELYASSSLETKFFSMDTHTIYPPCLEMRWDDSVFNTGSTNFGVVELDDFILLAENNLGDYKEDNKYRFKFRARDRFPARNFTTSSEYLNWKFLPSQSYWAIQDYKTKEMIVDFDNQFTKLSADSNGNYFTLYTNGLQPERSYKILIKTQLANTNEEIVIDNDIIFKVVR